MKKTNAVNLYCQSLPQFSFYLVVCFGTVSFRVQITPEPRPDWPSLGVFKIVIVRRASPSVSYGSTPLGWYPRKKCHGLLVYLFIYLFIYLSFRLSVRSFVHSFIQSVSQSVSRSVGHSYIYQVKVATNVTCEYSRVSACPRCPDGYFLRSQYFSFTRHYLS